MVVKICFKCLGKICVLYYCIVVVDFKIKCDGCVIEEIGKYYFIEEFLFIEVDFEWV